VTGATHRQEPNAERALDMSEAHHRGQLWIDRPDAPQKLASLGLPQEVHDAVQSLMQDGIALIRGAVPRSVCDDAITEYNRFAASRKAYLRANLDANGHEKRLVNFHLWSPAAAAIGINPRVMAILDVLFGEQTSVYTSLTFKYGTQQVVHRDTPHFATWPSNRFAGAWTALEDIHEDAGPLFYHPGGHRFRLEPGEFMREARTRMPDAPEKDQSLLALDLYNGAVIRAANALCEPVTLNLRAGDTVIWHPELPHGGSPAGNFELSRWSIVFHCAPVSTQVHQHHAFFTNLGGEPPPPRYGYTEHETRKIAESGAVAFM
jgi:phytanoyl-CoA hydroxylase